MEHVETWACLVCKDTPNFPTREQLVAHMRQHKDEAPAEPTWLN